MTIHIRDAGVGDIPMLQELFEEGDRLHCEQLPDLFRAVRGPSREETYLRAMIADWKMGVFVAEQATVLMGCLVVRMQETPEIPILVPQRYAVVDNIVVGEPYQGKGVGHQLMEHAETWAQARGIDRIELNVFEFNDRARRFYEHLGYGTLSRRMVKRLGRE